MELVLLDNILLSSSRFFREGVTALRYSPQEVSSSLQAVASEIEQNVIYPHTGSFACLFPSSSPYFVWLRWAGWGNSWTRQEMGDMHAGMLTHSMSYIPSFK